MKRLRNRLLQDKQGLSTVEYIIILGLVAVLGIASWKTFGQTLERETQEGEKSMDVVGQTP